MSATELSKTVLAANANLKAYYRFESGALTTDSSGNSNTLSAISDPAEGTGKFGGGVDLDGNDAYSITDHSTLKPTGSYSVGAWVKTSTSDCSIFCSYSANTAIAGIRFEIASGKMSVIVGNNTGTTLGANWTIITGVATVNDNVWHHVVFIFNGATGKIYVDGKHDVSSAWTNNNAYAATNYVRIGCSNDTGTNNRFLTGSLDDVFLLNGTALSADQIKELYEGRIVGEGWPQAGLVAGYHLSDTTDFSGNNYHLTNNGTATFPQGKFNKCVDLGTTNTSKWLSVNNNYGIDGTSITVSCWVKVNTEPANGVHYFFTFQGSANTKSAYILDYLNTTGTYTLTYSRDKTGVGSSGPIYTGAMGTTYWHHLVLTYDTVNVKGYFDGAYVGLAAASGNGTNASAANVFAIGGYYWNYTGTPGALASAMVDEIQVFNTVKDARWVRQQYALAKGFYV